MTIQLGKLMLRYWKKMLSEDEVEAWMALERELDILHEYRSQCLLSYDEFELD